MGRFRVRAMIAVIAVVSVSILLVSCASGGKGVIGNWIVDDGTKNSNGQIIFRADGTGEVTFGSGRRQSFEYTLDESKKPTRLEVIQVEAGQKTYWPNTIEFKDKDTILMTSGGGPNSKPGEALSASDTVTLHRVKVK